MRLEISYVHCFLAIVIYKVADSFAACGDGDSFELLDICTRPTETFSFTGANLHFHTHAIDSHVTRCTCDLMSDQHHDDLFFARRVHYQNGNPFDLYVFSTQTTVNFGTHDRVRQRKYVIQKDIPWRLIFARRNVSRDFTAEEDFEYCIAFYSGGSANLTLECQTHPESRVPVSSQAGVGLAAFLGSVVTVAVVCALIGAGTALCVRRHDNPLRHKPLPVCSPYRDSGFASDSVLTANGEAPDVDLGYTSFGNRENGNAYDVSDILANRNCSAERGRWEDGDMAVENVLYSS